MWLIYLVLLAMMVFTLAFTCGCDVIPGQEPFTPGEDTMPPVPRTLCGYPRLARMPIFKVDEPVRVSS